MTDVGCAKDKCCGGGNCEVLLQSMCHEVEATHRPQEDCMNYVPTMEFAGFGRAYVPQQRLCELFSGKEGFIAGTIFPELYKPYEGRFCSQSLESEEVKDFA